MGIVFQEYVVGGIIYRCRYCNIVLTSRSYRSSIQFICSHGPAWLFEKVVNVYHREAEVRILATGRHIIRDVHCKRCNRKIGWYYEMAFVPTQQYKETQTVLERQVLLEDTDDVPLNITGSHIND